MPVKSFLQDLGHPLLHSQTFAPKGCSILHLQYLDLAPI